MMQQAIVAFVMLLLCHQLKLTQSFELVTTGESELAKDGKHVGVNLPGILEMKLDTRGPPGSRMGARLQQSVLMGLVKVGVDRSSGPDKKLRGPIKVSVLGMTVYDNKEAPVVFRKFFQNMSQN